MVQKGWVNGARKSNIISAQRRAKERAVWRWEEFKGGSFCASTNTNKSPERALASVCVCVHLSSTIWPGWLPINTSEVNGESCQYTVMEEAGNHKFKNKLFPYNTLQTRCKCLAKLWPFDMECIGQETREQRCPMYDNYCICATIKPAHEMKFCLVRDQSFTIIWFLRNVLLICLLNYNVTSWCFYKFISKHYVL